MRRSIVMIGLSALVGGLLVLTGCYETRVEFTVTKISCNTFIFDASPSEGAYSYHWDFGDGETADEILVTHTYKEDGTYVVLLTINDAYGKSKSAWKTIEVNCRQEENHPPVAHLSISGNAHGTSGKYVDGELITFDGTSSYDPDFDELTYTLVIDGRVYIEEHTDYYVTTLPGPPGPSGCCSAPEVYLVTLTVSDGLAESSASRYIEVYAPGCHIH